MSAKAPVYTRPVARLLFVTGTPADVAGGSGTFVGISVLRRSIEARGHEVALVAPEPGRGDSFLGRLLFNVGARRPAASVRPDAVVGFDLDGLLLAAGGVPSFAWLRGLRSDQARVERGVPKLRLALESRFEKYRARTADGVLTSSAYSAGVIERDYGVGPDRIRVVPEGIELSRWRAALEPAPGLPRDPPGILCVAHLYPRKDVATLLEAMARLRNPAVLRVIGAGPELERLKRLADRLGLGERAEFAGHVPFARLAAEYRRAAIFCLPSLQEGFGSVFLEAMAAGVPVVAARAGAAPEVLGGSGALVPPGDPGALASALDTLLEDPVKRSAMAADGLGRVERFEAGAVAGEF